MTTQCYAMVRGSVMRLTRLDLRGNVVQGDRSVVVSRNVTKISIRELTDARPGVMEKSETEDIRLYAPDVEETIRYGADIDFTLTDPDAIEITSGQPVVLNPHGDVVGFDARTRVSAQAFALEVWSKLSVRAGGYRYGYTVFPFLKGGVLSGTKFENGSTTFSIKNALTQRGSRWSVGPYILNAEDDTSCYGGAGGWDTLDWDEYPWDSGVDVPRLASPVSRNLHWRNCLVNAAPVPSCGAIPLYDVIDGGTASSTSDDILDGQHAALTSSDIVDGGLA